MRAHSTLGLALAVLLAASCDGGPERPTTAEGIPIYSKVALSPSYHIDKKYKSMEGPGSEDYFTLVPGSSELLWILSYSTEVVDGEGASGAGLDEFLCHNNLDFQSPIHRDRFGLSRKVNYGRMFTTSQGVFSVDLPEGFGIPVFSDEVFNINTTVLNHNVEPADFDVRHKITIEYARDIEVGGKLKPLYPTFGTVMALVEGKDGFYGVEEEPTEHESGSSCAVGIVAPNAPGHTQFHHDAQGRRFTQHWVVPPGREVRRTLVTDVMNLPFDTTIHHIAAHLHPYAESLELRDLTSGETIFRASARAPSEGVGLASVEEYSSAEGIPVYADHAYEMVSTYQNDTGVEQDAMATFFIYFYDSEVEARLGALREGLAAAAPAPGA